MKKLTMEELDRISVTEFKESEKSPVVIILDNVRSQHNVGSIFRTADAFRIAEIHLCGITATPPNREIQKTALGATESVNWKYFDSTQKSIELLKELGYKIIAVEQVHDSVAINDFKSEEYQKLALIFGNEVHGVDEEILALCDSFIEIPQFGTKHSLNVSVSAGIVIWEICKRLTDVTSLNTRHI